jgi:D-beta-D-heptose 7-phosphate kinase/D-beta-D-heptose 1-phosphate adenosyltransferase
MFTQWDELKNKKVTVVGDVMLDQYWSGTVDRISPEAPIPVVKITSENSQLGGAGNVTVNLAKLGVMTELYAMVGEDKAGEVVAKLLSTYPIQSQLHVKSTVVTTHKLRVLSMSQQLIRLDFETEQTAGEQEFPIDWKKMDLSSTDVLVLSDYMKGSLGDPQPWIQAAKARKIPILVDTKAKDLTKYRGISLLKPNRREFELWVGRCSNQQMIEKRARELMQQYAIENMLVTLGKEGMLLIPAGGDAVYFHAKARDVFDVTGAGDTVIATVAAIVAAGATLREAVELASIAAGMVVQKLGAAAITATELKALQLQSTVYTQEQLQIQVESAKKNGEKIVMTNGCFDVLHAGHVQYLQQAKALGNRLIVAVNSDESVRLLKGDSRPINSLADRMAVIAALASVDWVVSFSQETPQALIEQIKPDVLVKGGDYQVEEIAGSGVVLANGGEVIIVPLRAGCSSTRIIEALE